MTAKEFETELDNGRRVGEGDFRLWIRNGGLPEALKSADNKLSRLMAETGVTSAEDAKQKMHPYIAGMMMSLEAFIKRHCAAKPYFPPENIRKIGNNTYRIPADGLGS